MSLSLETRQKIRLAHYRLWDRMSPEQRYERLHKLRVVRRRNEQLREIRDGTLPRNAVVCSYMVDEDFNDMLYPYGGDDVYRQPLEAGENGQAALS